MTKQGLADVLEACRELLGHARGAGRRAAAAVTERFRDRLPAGRGVVDVYELQLALADELAAMRAELVAWEDRHDREVRRGRRLRRRRGRLEAELRATILRLKRLLTGAYDAGTAGRLLRPVRRLAATSAALQRQAERFHATLTDPALELPPPRPGVEIDIALAARSVEQPLAALAETAAALAECEAAARHARARRDEALARLAVFTDKAARFSAALCDLARR